MASHSSARRAGHLEPSPAGTVWAVTRNPASSRPPSKPTDLACGNEIPIRTIYKTFREEERNLLEILQLSSADSFSENLLLNGLVEQTVMGDVVEKRANSLLCAKVRSELQIICEAERQSSAASRWFRQHQNVMNCFWKVPNRVKIIKNNEPIEMLSGEILKEYGEPMIGHTSLEDGRKSDSYPHIMHLFSENATAGKRLYTTDPQIKNHFKK